MSIETLPLTSLGAAAAAVVDKLVIVDAIATAPAPKNEPLAPGVYFGLDEDLYHADPALGSTDMKRLAYSPCDYWFSSAHNPMREAQEETPAQAFGKAVHKFVLEGREAFEAAYGPTDSSGATKAGKAEREAIEATGKRPLKRPDWNRIQLAGTMIRSNAAIAAAFSGGAAEVSVFWERDGIRRKARIDYLKPRATVDLKSISNSRQIDFVDACRRSIAEWRYDIQAEHYDEARGALRDLVAAGAVHGDHDDDWLARVAGANERASVIVFYQSAGAPLTWGTQISPGNGVRDLARATIAKAEANYREFSARFGFDAPWVLSEPLEELDVNDLPAWAFRS